MEQSKAKKDEAAKLFLDYNAYRLQTLSIQTRRDRGEYVNSYKLTLDRLNLFLEMAEWCRERQLDPRLWLYVLFRARKWTFPPQLKKSHLCSKNMIERYKKVAEKDYLDGYRAKLLDEQTETATDFDPNRDLNHSTEGLKKWFLEKHLEQKCMSESFVRTLGFHPKSLHCANCALREPCAKQLIDFVDFDIMALRRGEITAAQAKAQASAATTSS